MCDVGVFLLEGRHCDLFYLALMSRFNRTLVMLDVSAHYGAQYKCL